MKMNSYLFKLAMIVFLSTLFGCAISSPEDLRVEKLSLAKVTPETKEEIDYGRYVDEDGSFYRLRLELSTDTDLVKLGQEYHLIYQPYFCERSDYKVHMSRGQLYWSGKDVQGLGLLMEYGREEVPEGSISKEPEYQTIRSVDKGKKQRNAEENLGSDSADERHIYTMYLGLYSPEVESWKKNSGSSHQNEFEAYDLVVQPEDVCIVIEGRMQLGGGFQSNVVKIDRGMIKTVLNGMEPVTLKEK
ncbi:hypothetical protein [Gallaecimonas xiamenensis]|uniref:Lipoprotein n=1 Tax=Gallaecimonas xiamenensis 3-C-1 TaxID=745411 RepID=K2JI04_9GAMM|nr:hypothetical protein [Gallaecimonas xiamenensis]EKE70274.1 hypothetical protein B3C1_14268 [Gallaecimonas xiamenensis 3-C-1]